MPACCTSKYLALSPLNQIWYQYIKVSSTKHTLSHNYVTLKTHFGLNHLIKFPIKWVLELYFWGFRSTNNLTPKLTKLKPPKQLQKSWKNVDRVLFYWCHPYVSKIIHFKLIYCSKLINWHYANLFAAHFESQKNSRTYYPKLAKLKKRCQGLY